MDSTMLERALGSGIPYITYAIPFFFPLIGAEAAICAAYGLPYYRLHDSISDLACGVADQVVGLFLKTALFAGYLACYAFVTSRGLNLLDVDAYGPATSRITGSTGSPTSGTRRGPATSCTTRARSTT